MEPRSALASLKVGVFSQPGSGGSSMRFADEKACAPLALLGAGAPLAPAPSSRTRWGVL